MAERVDLLIIGAGAAGLGTALELARNGAPPNWKVVILDRDDRVGGKVHTDPDEAAFDYGAAYLGRAQTAIIRLVNRYIAQEGEKEPLTWTPGDPATRRHAYENYFTGGSFWQPVSDRVCWGEGNYPSPPQAVGVIASLEALALLLRMWLRLGRPVWTFPHAAWLDGLNCRQLLDALKIGPPEPYTIKIMDVAVRSAFSVEAEEMSALYLVLYSALCGGFLEFENVNGKGDSHRLRKGMSWLLGCMKEEVEQYWPGCVRTGVRVTHLDADGDGDVVVTTAAGETIHAGRVVVAASPFLNHWKGHKGGGPKQSHAVIGGSYCSAAQKALAAAMVPGLTRKVFVRYEAAWWREAKLSGYGLSHAGPIDWFMDNCGYGTGDDAEKLVTPALMAFVVSKQVVPFDAMSPVAQAACINAHVQTVFAEKVPGGVPVGKVHVSPMPNMHCPAAVFPPGALTTHEVDLREPYRSRVYFAASELGRHWPGGYVNGALDSAAWTAKRLLADAGAPPGPTPGDLEDVFDDITEKDFTVGTLNVASPLFLEGAATWLDTLSTSDSPAGLLIEKFGGREWLDEIAGKLGLKWDYECVTK